MTEIKEANYDGPVNILQDQNLNDLLEQMGGCRQASGITHVDRIKAAICGEPKTGKSKLVADTCRKPLLEYDFDDRAESIAGAKDVVIKTLIDRTDTEYNAWNKLETDVGLLEYYKSMDKLPFQSVCLDSISFLRQYAEHQFLNDSSRTSRLNFKIGSTNYVIPKDWDAVTGIQKMLQGILRRLFALNIDVYAIFHTRQEKDNVRSTKTEAVYTDKLTVDPPNLKMLLPMFNETWRTFVSNGEYKVQVKPSNIFLASTALHNLETEEICGIQGMLEKHNSKV